MVDTIQSLVRDLEARGAATALVAYTADGKDEWTYQRLGETARLWSTGLGGWAQMGWMRVSSNK